MPKKIRTIKSSKSFKEKISGLRSQIHPETEQTVLGVIFIGASAVMLLASFRQAGPAGDEIYKALSSFFGWGYYLFPKIFFLMALSFLSGIQRKEKAMTITFIGAAIFVASGLGIIDIVFPSKGGMIGEWMGLLENLFGFAASLVVAGTIFIAALLLTLNLPIKFWRRKENEEKPAKEIAPQIIIKNPEAFASPAVKPETVKATESETKKETKLEPEVEMRVNNPNAYFVPRGKSLTQTASGKNYTPPPLDLLKSSIEKPTAGDLRANANIIKRTLDSFGIPVEMGEITIGPKVTRYTLKPAEGIKLSRILALNQDLSLALAAHPIRIEAPIPGKSLVGIEVPNKSAAIVRLGSLMNFPEFTASGTLGFILGRDVSGDPIVADIAKMPHLLIAGSTGSGKSVAIHALIISLLYKNSPETLKMILIDPKRVELTLYNGIPHLVTPVITEGRKALGVFRWAIEEMEQRYGKLQAAGCRDIASYNKNNPNYALSYLVIIVDELADLMAAYGREIEGSVVRLAQMARATGIHLILSTQRPSVEVITGLIKANITSRMALQVASQVDSRTILDMAGAEKLLGGGDMLFASSDLSKPKRIQGAYISEEELKKVTDFIREHNPSPLEEQKPAALEKSLNQSSKSEGLNFENYAKEDDEDDLYDEAVRVVREAQKASASLLQRRLAVGYARAARLLDIMEDRGVVGPGDGAKPREVYLDSNEQS